MSKTFCEVVQVGNHLGIQHLWIDSLCIVQDAAEDWAGEAAKIATIYRNTALTITAAWAPDADQGLFTPGDPALSSVPLSLGQHRAPVQIYVEE